LRGKEHTSHAEKLRKSRKGDKHVNKLNEILEAYTQFQTYLSTIQLDELKKQHTRKELDELKDNLREIKKRELPYELGMLADEMRKEEHPEILGVHYFPVIKEIDFLTEPEKVALDKMLARQRKSYFLTANGWRVVTKTTAKHQPLVQFLLEKSIIKEEKVLVCPHCEDSHLTRRLSLKEVAKLESDIKAYQQATSYTERESLCDTIRSCVNEYCDECDAEVDWTTRTKFHYKTFHTVAAEADRTLDAV
jgi:hypothetical protein